MDLLKLNRREVLKILSEFEESHKRLLEENDVTMYTGSFTREDRDYRGSLRTPIPLTHDKVPHSYNPEWNPPTPLFTDVEGLVLAEKIAEMYKIEFGRIDGDGPIFEFCFSDSKEMEKGMHSVIGAKKDFSSAYEKLQKDREKKISSYIGQTRKEKFRA